MAENELQLEIAELLSRLNHLIYEHSLGRIRAVILDEKASHIFGLVPYQSAYVHSPFGEIRVACGPLIRKR